MNPNHVPKQFPPPAAAAAIPAPASGSLDASTQQQIMLIKALADQGIPFDKIPAIIQGIANGSAPPLAPPGGPVPASQGSYPPQQPWQASSAAPVRDDSHNRGYDNGMRSPQRYHGRSRSKSPDRGWGGRGSPRNGRDGGRDGRDGRDSRDYGRNSSPQRDRNGRRGNDYRQRSPPGRRGPSPSPELPDIERWIEFDPTLPSGTIKVLSRTLFVGGVT